MSLWRLVWRSLVYDRRSLTGTLLGSLLAAMVLVGALIIGDSVRSTLRRQAELRIGSIDRAMITGDRLIRAELADAIERDAPDDSIAPMLRLQGMASTADRTRRALNVALMGVDDRFFAMAPDESTAPTLNAGEALINSRLADQLSIGPGDTFVLRVDKPSALSRDLTFATTDDAVLALRVKVAAIVQDDQFGRFSLTADQIPPFNVFVPIEWLQANADQPGRANMLLAHHRGVSADLPRLQTAAATNWTIDDLGLSTRPSGADQTNEWRSSRVFIDAPIVEAVAELEPRALGVLTYFVNEIRLGGRATPYSTIAGIGSLTGSVSDTESWNQILPPDLADNEIIISEWLAEDLDAAPGESVEIRYFVLDAGRTLTEQTAQFTVRAIVPIAGPAADPELMPDIPGLSDSVSCREWNPGIPVELDRIRDQDEVYWDEHRGTPKAFITLRRAQSLWANRFGTLTAIRIPEQTTTSLTPQALIAQLAPEAFGFTFQPIREQALAAAKPTTDFGGLFIGLSLFLIVSALLLIGMLFAFTVNQRQRQIGTLMAVGWREQGVRGWLVSEAAIVAALGSLAGALLAVGYSRLLLTGLSTIWKQAVASAPLELHLAPLSLALGTGLSFVAAMISMHLAIRTLLRQHAIQLLGGEFGEDTTRLDGPRWPVLPILICLSAASGLACIGWALFAGEGSAVAAFFLAGFLLLLAGVLASRWILTRLLLKRPSAEHLSFFRLAIRSASRRPGRSTASIALLASGCFLVVAVGMNRLVTPADSSRHSGTGGFALIGQTSIPLLADLDSAETRQELNLEDGIGADVAFVPLRVRGGDDASCLNLNRAQQPRVLGVNPQQLASREAFAFAARLDSKYEGNPWLLLDEPLASSTDRDVIPAIVDQASMMWAMHRRLGDIVEYEDDAGRTIGLQLVATLSNSILQGNLIISEAHFEKYFPSQSGHRLLLVDAPAESANAVASTLTRSLADIGLELVPTTTRLAEYNSVQNTYMAVFQVLGGLGLIVGTAGLGMVLLRNVSERRGELALLIALGFTSRDLRRLLFTEHTMLLALGLSCGVGAAIPAVWPAVSQSASGATITSTVGVVLLIALSGLMWVGLATRWATRGRLIDSLRYE